MQTSRRYSLLSLCAALGLMFLSTPHGIAQEQPAATGQKTATEQKADRGGVPAVSPDPTVTTAVFGDWVLRCVKAGQEAKKPICEIIQSIVIEGQQAPIAQIALGRMEAAMPMNLTVLLPNNVTLLALPRLTLDEGGKKPADLVWQRCVPAGCFASLEADEALLESWAKAQKPGKLTFAEGGGQSVALPFSLRGFTQAMNALSKPGG